MLRRADARKDGQQAEAEGWATGGCSVDSCGSAWLENVPEESQCDSLLFSLKAVSRGCRSQARRQPRRWQNRSEGSQRAWMMGTDCERALLALTGAGDCLGEQRPALWGVWRWTRRLIAGGFRLGRGRARADAGKGEAVQAPGGQADWVLAAAAEERGRATACSVQRPSAEDARRCLRAWRPFLCGGAAGAYLQLREAPIHE